MKASRLSFDNIIDINARTGMISVKGKRMALMSTEALGLLRRDLVITFGIEKAKHFIMQYGWVCGYNDAEIMESRNDWDSKDEIYFAGPAMHTLEGFVTAEAYIKEVKNGIPLFYGFWWNSFEAEEHIKHFGMTEETVCWMLVGYANGYAAKIFGNGQVLFNEKTCRAKGDEYCSFENKFVGDSVVEVLKKVDTKYNKSSRNEFDRIYLEVSQLNKDLLEVEEIQKKLNQLILDDKTPIDIIQYAATVLDCSIIYKNKDAEKIACFKMNEEEKILRDWMKAGEPSSTIIKKRYVESFHIHGSKYFGNLVVIGEKQLRKIDKMKIERILLTLSIQLNYQEKIAQSLVKKRQAFFEHLFTEGLEIDASLKDSSIYGFNSQKSHYVISLNIFPKDRTEEVLYYLISENPQWNQYSKNQNIFIIIDSENVEHIDHFMKGIVKEINAQFPDVHLYAGSGRLAESVDQLGKSYLDACSISKYLQLMYPNANKIATFKELQPIMLFVNAANHEELIEFYTRTLGRLIEYEQSSQSNFVETLNVYLENSGNLQQTANDLHISIAGLRYRIERIETLCEVDLKTGEGRFQCQLALKVYYSIKMIDELVVS